jgi:hypothetical protein
VLRKAYGRAAGLVGLAVSLVTVAGLLVFGVTGLLRGTFPVMVVLGPLLVGQYLVWRRWRGPERTTWQYLHAEPLPAR